VKSIGRVGSPQIFVDKICIICHPSSKKCVNFSLPLHPSDVMLKFYWDLIQKTTEKILGFSSNWRQVGIFVNPELLSFIYKTPLFSSAKCTNCTKWNEKKVFLVNEKHWTFKFLTLFSFNWAINFYDDFSFPRSTVFFCCFFFWRFFFIW